MTEVFVQITAFDKNSNDNFSRNIVADCKESFNSQVEHFENDVPFTKYYLELVADDILNSEQQKIVEDYEVN
jgi:hypothetical protein